MTCLFHNGVDPTFGIFPPTDSTDLFNNNSFLALLIEQDTATGLCIMVFSTFHRVNLLTDLRTITQREHEVIFGHI